MVNEIVKTKKELAGEVVAKVDAETEYPDEFETKLLKKIESVVSFK